MIERRVATKMPATRERQLVQRASIEAPPSADHCGNEARDLYRWLASLSETLINLRRAFSGDLDQLVIYLVFVMGETGRQGQRPPRGINALSVSDITLIPRETARRKLRELASSGYLRCAEDGLWYVDEANRMAGVAAALAALAEEGDRFQPVASRSTAQ